jgi:hypothetical protein
MQTVLRLVAVVLMLSAPVAGAADPAADAVAAAERAATTWLALVDAGRYAESWEAASSVFRKGVTKADWEKAARAAREPLGALKSRTTKSATFTRTLPGAPDGEYVVIQTDARFEHKAAAVETVTPMREKDGAWRVSGYYVR